MQLLGPVPAWDPTESEPHRAERASVAIPIVTSQYMDVSIDRVSNWAGE